MATKFRIETCSGKRWLPDSSTSSYDKKEDAIPVAEYIATTRKVETRVSKVVTKTVWQSKKPEINPK